MRIVAIILRKIQGVWYQIGAKNLNEKSQEFKWKGKKFLVDTSRCIFMAKKKIIGHKGILLYDSDLSNPIEPSNIDFTRIDTLTSDEHDFYFGGKTIKDLVRGSLNRLISKEMILLGIVFLALGVFLGVFIAPYIPSPITPTTPITPIIPPP